jgi:hypothetical protein
VVTLRLLLLKLRRSHVLNNARVKNKLPVVSPSTLPAVLKEKHTGIYSSIFFNNTSCTQVNNSHVEIVKYLMNKNYSILILINIENVT